MNFLAFYLQDDKKVIIKYWTEVFQSEDQILSMPQPFKACWTNI